MDKQIITGKKCVGVAALVIAIHMLLSVLSTWLFYSVVSHYIQVDRLGTSAAAGVTISLVITVVGVVAWVRGVRAGSHARVDTLPLAHVHPVTYASYSEPSYSETPYSESVHPSYSETNTLPSAPKTENPSGVYYHHTEYTSPPYSQT